MTSYVIPTVQAEARDAFLDAARAYLKTLDADVRSDGELLARLLWDVASGEKSARGRLRRAAAAATKRTEVLRVSVLQAVRDLAPIVRARPELGARVAASLRRHLAEVCDEHFGELTDETILEVLGSRRAGPAGLATRLSRACNAFGDGVKSSESVSDSYRKAARALK